MARQSAAAGVLRHGGTLPNVYVVSLPRCTQRRRHIASQLERLGVAWQWVDGVDARKARGSLLGPQYVTPEFAACAASLPTPERGALRPGAVACALSHKMAHERLIASCEPWGLVLEDDLDLPEDFSALVGEVGSELDPDVAEVTLLNFHCPGGLELSTTGTSALGSGRLLAKPAELCQLTSGAAYALTREAARRLTDHAFPMRTFSDEWGSFVLGGLLERVRVVVPMPVQQSLDFRTTIDYRRPGSVQWWAREAIDFLRLDQLPGVRAFVEKRRARDMDRWGAFGKFKFRP